MADKTSVAATFTDILLDTCEEGLSGTIFVVSKKNRSGQIVIKNGLLLGINYCGYTTEEALDTLLKCDNLRCSFTSDLIFPLASCLSPDHAIKLMNSIRVKKSPCTKGQEESANRERDVPCKIIYRGQKVERKTVQATVKDTKSGLIYRGQVIH